MGDTGRFAMRDLAFSMTVFAALAGCSQVIGLRDVTIGDAEEVRVGGQVRGLWDGADGVALRLEADGVETLLSVSANGTFQFEELLAAGTSYTVTVATNPVRHTCIIDAGGNGVVADTEITSVSVACTGPAVTVALSGRWGWTFDATAATQRFKGSVIVQDVSLTISGSTLTDANVNGAAAMLGRPTAPIALPLGSTTVPIVLKAHGGLSKSWQFEFERGGAVLDQLMYGKASNTDGEDRFGVSIAISGDTLAVGASGESSAASGVNGNQADDTATSAGAVYVFVRSGTIWAQQAYIKASNTREHNYFGQSIALSGNTLAVGAYGESSPSTGINGSQTNSGENASGAVYVFVRNGTTWTQEAYVKASNTASDFYFGASVALVGDVLAVGSPGVRNALDHSALDWGAAYVFTRSGTTWTQQAYLRASNTEMNDRFGASIALFGDTLAIGAPGEASLARTINGNQADNSAPGAGAVYVFVRSVVTWTQQAYIKASNTEARDDFGSSLALHGDTLVVGAPHEDGAATGVNGDQANNAAQDAGALYVYTRVGLTWTQQAYVKASNTQSLDLFGSSLAVFGDTLAVGAAGEDSAATSINGSQTTDDAASAGAAYVFVREGTTWTQRLYAKSSNTGVGDNLGRGIALSGDTLVIAANGESSAALGLNGSQSDNTAPSAGAIYVFR